jgi:hypothetical protein
LNGFGPGTFEQVWLPRASYYSYVQNAHSLYVETFTDTGLVGLVLLVGFFVVVVGAAVRMVIRTRHETRTAAAGITAALIAFCVSAAFDWIWQVPVLPAAFLLLAGAVLVTRARRPSMTGAGRIALRVGIVVAGLACLVAIGVPLATASDVRKSQSASSGGNQAVALSDALAAARVESGAASPQVQAALVLELQHHPAAALVYARRAAGNEPNNWSTWLIISRLEAETGHARASVAAYGQARALNPRSPVFGR